MYNSLPPFNYLYEFKIVLFYFILILAINGLCNTEDAIIKNIKVAINIFAFFSFINIILSILQRHYFHDIIGVFGFNSSTDARDSFGSENNIVIQTQNGLFRSIGSFSAPMVLAEYLMFSAFFFSIKMKRLYYKLAWFSLCSIGVYYTSYKTVLMYLPAVAIMIFANYKYMKLTTSMSGALLLGFGLLATHTDIIYNIANPISPLYAEYSILFRIEFLYKVFNQMNNAWQLIFGVGYGYNGGFLGYFEQSVPLDSIYIWLLSNYGLCGVLLFIVFLVFLYNYNPFNADNQAQRLFYSCKYYLILVLCGNFFWNNLIINFPSLLFPVVFIVLFYNLSKFEINKSL